MMAKKEFLALVDHNNMIIGKAEAGHVILKVQWHRAIRVFICNSKGEWLLLKRPKGKRIYPDCWEIGVGGGVRYNETGAQAARRELKEELGIRVASEKLKPIKHAVKVQTKVDHVFADVFLMKYDGKVKPQISEVDEIIWLDKSKISRFPNSQPKHQISFHYFKKWSKEGLL